MVNRSASELARIVFKAASGSLALRVAALALGFATNILLARAMGTSGFGAYAYLLAWVNFLYVPAMLGTDKLLVREVAILESQEKWGLLRGISGWCGRWVLFCAVVLASLMVYVVSLRSGDSVETSLGVLLVAATLIPLLALTGLRQAILKGLGAVVHGQLPETVIRPALLILAIVIWYIFANGQLQLFDALAFNVGAALVAFLVGAIILKRRFPEKARQADSESSSRMWLVWSLPLLLLGFSQSGSAQLPMLMLGFFSTEHDVGLFAAASRIALLGNFFLLALNAAFAPRVAALYAAGERISLQILVSKTSLWVTLCSAIPLLIIILAGRQILAVFGPDFTEAYNILVIMAAGVFVNASMGSVGLLLTMTRNVRAALYGAVAALVLNLVFSAILIPRYGAIGAAWSSTIVLIFGNIVYGFFVYKKIGIIPTFAALAMKNRNP